MCSMVTYQPLEQGICTKHADPQSHALDAREGVGPTVSLIRKQMPLSHGTMNLVMTSVGVKPCGQDMQPVTQNVALIMLLNSVG